MNFLSYRKNTTVLSLSLSPLHMIMIIQCTRLSYCIWDQRCNKLVGQYLRNFEPVVKETSFIGRGVVEIPNFKKFLEDDFPLSLYFLLYPNTPPQIKIA
jgi:hypothetical protein